MMQLILMLGVAVMLIYGAAVEGMIKRMDRRYMIAWHVLFYTPPAALLVLLAFR